MEILSAIATSFVTSIFEHCSAPIARRIGYYMNIERNVRNLKREGDKLTSSMNDVKSRVEAEERNHKKRTDTVQLWLDMSLEITTQARAIVDEFEQRKMRLIGCCPNCRSRYRIGKAAIEMYNDVVEHEQGAPSDGLTVMPSPERVALVEALRIEGQTTFNQMTKQILDWIHGEQDGGVNRKDVEVIGVYGMGGVGKTTLMQNINNELLETKDFDVVIMVGVFHKPNFGTIREQIQKRLGVTQIIGDDELMSILRTKRYLLILDDVWEAFDLREIGVPQTNNEKNSKLVVVTRDVRVCINMGVGRHKIEVKCLEEKEAWSLFKKTVGENFIESPSILPHAMEVLHRCGGLPLAIVTVARAMTNNKTQRDWEDAKSVLRQLATYVSATDVGEIKEKVFVPLKFSYDRLRNEYHKKCFLYCCLYPEDYAIPKGELIEYWMGEGLLGDSWNLNLNETRSGGRVLINSLVESGMLEIAPDVEDRVTMHDVMRELAIWITSQTINGSKFITQAFVGLREAPEAEEWKQANRISLMRNEIRALQHLQECPQLSTLFLQINLSLKEIPSIDFFECMTGLRVLDLSCTGISSLPSSFSHLVNLRVLLLTEISELKQIPHIGSLQQLRILNLSGSGITELPEGLNSLASLRRLVISYTFRLSKIQPGIITKLSRLEELDVWDCGSDLGVVLKESTDLYNLTTFEMSTSDATLVQGNAFSILGRRQQLKINLEVSDCKGLDHIPPFNNLIALYIQSCDDIERVFVGEKGDSGGFQRLESLILRFLGRLLVIYDGGALPRGSFSNLKEIIMSDCPKTKKLFSILVMPQLQNLSKLSVWSCDELQEIFGGEEVGEVGLPSLKRLRLAGLPELTCISPVLNPPASLEFLEILNCPKLNKLPLGTHHAQCLEKIKGQKEWWDGLQWVDESIKSSLQPLFFGED